MSSFIQIHHISATIPNWNKFETFTVLYIGDDEIPVKCYFKKKEVTPIWLIGIPLMDMFLNSIIPEPYPLVNVYIATENHHL